MQIKTAPGGGSVSSPSSRRPEHRVICDALAGEIVAEWCWNEITAAPVSLGNYSYVDCGSWADNAFVCSFESPGLETTADFSLPGLRLARNSTAVVNNAPTKIVLSAASIAENQPSGTAVGEFFTTDSDAGDTFTYALAVADGTLTAAAVAGITVGGSDTARTIAGTPAALNAYFKTAGRIKYTTATNNTVARTLTRKRCQAPNLGKMQLFRAGA